MALGMAMNGVAGATFGPMPSALRFGAPSQAEVDASCRRLLALLLGLDPRVEIGIANSAWARKGSRTSPFDPDRTRRAPFRREDGSTVDVDMLHARGVQLWVGSSDAAQIVELPYGGKAFTMVVVLPPAGTRLADLVAGLDGGRRGAAGSGHFTRWKAR